MLALTRWQQRCYSTKTAAMEIEDALKVAALIHSFRNDGHLAAALDPLHRVRQGPWLAEHRRATTWCEVQLDWTGFLPTAFRFT